MNEKEKQDLESKLTYKQLKFVNEYLKDFNGAAAYLRAGYQCSELMSRRAASRLLSTNVHVKNYLSSLQKEIREELHIDRNMIIGKTLEILDRCMQVKPVVDKSGKSILTETPTGELAAAYTFDAANSLKALEFLAKIAGLLNENEMAEDDRPRINIVLKSYLQNNNEYVNQIIREAEDKTRVNN